jgi:hypothetical protein
MNMNLQGYSGLMTVTRPARRCATANFEVVWNDNIARGCTPVSQLFRRSMARSPERYRNPPRPEQFECSVAMNAPLLLATAVTEARNPPRTGNRSDHDLRLPMGFIAASGPDNWCAISVQYRRSVALTSDGLIGQR